MKKRFIALLTCMALIMSVICFSFDSEAASAKSVLKKAYKQMKKYDTVFYCGYSVYKDNGVKESGGDFFSISDLNISHSFSNNEEWHIKSRRYTRYDSSSSWNVESTEYDNKTPKHYYGKKYHQYALKNLINPKIKKNNKKYYIISGKDPTDYYETLEFKINKKDYSIMEMVWYVKDSSYTANDGTEHTVTNQKWIFTNVCYGHGKLKAPKLLK